MRQLPLPDDVYEGLLAFTTTQGTTPADWIAAQVLPAVRPSSDIAAIDVSDLIGSVDSRNLSHTPPPPTIFEKALLDKMARQGLRIP